MLSSESEAARWIVVNKTALGTQYVDFDAVVIDKSIATIWVRTEVIQPTKRGASISLEKWLHDCANNRAKLVAITFYKADGSVVGSAAVPGYEENWSDVVPGSATGVVHQRICS